MGVVDVLAEDGEETVRDYVALNKRKHNAHVAMYQARRWLNPLTYDELKEIVETWVDAALRLSEAELRKMAHLAAAQQLRFTNGQAVNVSLLLFKAHQGASENEQLISRFSIASQTVRISM
jgi:hypothetical protein